MRIVVVVSEDGDGDRLDRGIILGSDICEGIGQSCLDEWIAR